MEIKWWHIALAGAAIYFLTKRGETKSIAGSIGTGMGVGGSPRFGMPKTERERMEEHALRFGTPLPQRGTGIARRR